jgi:uncharacterized protein (UPF0333 family)
MERTRYNIILSTRRNILKRTLLAVAIALLAMTIVASFCMKYVKAENEKASIEAADSAINQAFTNVSAAQEAGGNVTQLLARLDSAGELLAEADNGYRSGNLTNVASEAGNARSIADQVNSDAVSLLKASVSRSQNNLILTLFFSMDGAVIFAVVLLVIWRRFKRGYMKKLLRSKPEVVKNTA